MRGGRTKIQGRRSKRGKCKKKGGGKGEGEVGREGGTKERDSS